VTCTLDLSPAYGKIEEKKTVSITRPSPDILDRRLEELKSKNAGTRRTAAMDLSYFPEEEKRVFPALVACLDDADEGVRMNVLNSMGSYGNQIKQHASVLIELLENGKELEYCRGRAAYLLGMHAPVSEEVEKALTSAAEAMKGGTYEQYVMNALDRYRRRAQEDAAKDAGSDSRTP
jgi:hypothetical protein